MIRGNGGGRSGVKPHPDSVAMATARKKALRPRRGGGKEGAPA